MKLTAEQFNKHPAQAYRAADKGERVEIEHSRYPGVVFVLTQESTLYKAVAAGMNAAGRALAGRKPK